MPTPLAQISAAGKRRQPHRRRGDSEQKFRKFSMSMPPDIRERVAAESETQGRTQAAVVVDRLRESYGLATEPQAAGQAAPE